MMVLDGGDQLPQVALHLLGVAYRPVDQVIADVFVQLGGANAADHQLRAEANMHGVAGAEVDHAPGAAQLLGLLNAIGHDRGHAAGPIAHRQAQELTSVAAPMAARIANQQRLSYIASFRKLPDFHRVSTINWGADGRSMKRSAIVTGGTGGLGSAVVARLLDDGWRVVVPWVAEHELQRIASRDGLELVQADLFDPDAVRAVIAAAAAGGAPPLGGLVNLVGGFAAGAR